jgi:hypothetical protein
MQKEKASMLMALPGNPSSFTLIPAIQYGEVPGLPWADKPWDEMGWKALAFFQRHLCK